MKTLSMIFAILLVAVTANAQFNAPSTATASFDCMVIAPIGVSQPAAVNLVDCIAGQTRDIVDVPVTFTITHQPTIGVSVSFLGTILDAGLVGDRVSLTGDWSAVPTVFTAGTFPMTYTIKTINANDAVTPGTRTFTLKVSASYTTL